MSGVDDDLLRLVIALRDACTMIVEAVNAYLENKAPPEVKIEQVQALFPEDLRTLLSFKDKGDCIVAMPKAYLGAENFAKIAEIVRKHGGDYVSKGKESHFKIPKKPAK